MAKENLQIVSSVGANGGKVLHLKGSLNIHTVFNFQDLVRAETVPSLILDFSEVPYIDSAGLGVLVGIHIGAQKAMRRLVFAGMNAQVKALMDMTKVSQLFQTYPTVKDAEAALS